MSQRFASVDIFTRYSAIFFLFEFVEYNDTDSIIPLVDDDFPLVDDIFPLVDDVFPL